MRNYSSSILSFFKDLLEENDSKYKINVLCHSMGNRIFQHMINESDLIDEDEILIDQFISSILCFLFSFTSIGSTELQDDTTKDG